MEVILDELTPKEFFTHGGVVKIQVTNPDIAEIAGRKKMTFFEYWDYVKFLNTVTLGIWEKKQDLPTDRKHSIIREGIDIEAHIGTRKYILDPDYDRQASLTHCTFYYYGEKGMAEGLVKGRDPYGIKNVCFSLIDEADTRWLDFCAQREERGFDDSELWSLDGTIAKFIAPRLKAFYEGGGSQCHPACMTIGEWCDILKRMVEGFDLMASDDDKTEEEEAKEDDALSLFAEHFHALWI